MRAACALLIPLLLAGRAPSALGGDEAPPVPPEPRDQAATESRTESGAEQTPAKTKARARSGTVVPGFGPGLGSSEEEGRPRRATHARSAGEGDDEIERPVSVPEQGTNERLIQDLNAATGDVTLLELLDEILADVVAELGARPAKTVSPLSIRQISLGSNVSASFRPKLEALITSALHAGTSIRVFECLECDATRTRLEGGQWILTRGLVTTAELRRVGEDLGVKAFMDVAFGFDPETSVLELDVRVIRANDARVLWAESFRADETTPLLVRAADAPMRRKDRLRDLEMLLEGRPLYGYVASAGFMLLPYDDPSGGDIGGATAGYRIYERFGTERRVMFGLDLTGFLNTSRLSGAVISAGSWWVPIRPDLVNPELRLGGKAGAFVAGSAGNAAVFQLGAELILRYRFGVYAYALIMTRSEFPPGSGHSLGGIGTTTGMSFNW